MSGGDGYLLHTLYMKVVGCVGAVYQRPVDFPPGGLDTRVPARRGDLSSI